MPNMPNLYDEEPAPAAEGPTDKPVEKPTDGEHEDGPTALLPKSILGGKEFKEGEEIVLRIEKVYPDQVEVAYAADHEEDAAGAMDEKPEMAADPMYD